MWNRERIKSTLSDLIVALTRAVAPMARKSLGTSILNLRAPCCVPLNVRPKPRPPHSRYQDAARMCLDSRHRRRWPAIMLAMLLLISPGAAAAGPAADQLKGSVDRIQSILTDSGLKGESKKTERRRKLREVVYSRFDFEEMAKRSLGAEWKKRNPEERKEFVQLFTGLLEDAYIDALESYNGESVRYINERQDQNYTEVNTKLANSKGEEFSLDYRLHHINGEWKVFDVVIENISLVNNYRAQFRRVLAKSSYRDLIESMKGKVHSTSRTQS